MTQEQSQQNPKEIFNELLNAERSDAERLTFQNNNKVARKIFTLDFVPKKISFCSLECILPSRKEWNYTIFLEAKLFFNSASVLLNFSMN